MKRESNIELLRIVAMLLVVLVHTNYFSLGGVESVDIQTNMFGAFVKAFAEQLCLICVNVFILISGWFGIRANMKGALSFIFQAIFYHILIIIFFYSIGESIPLDTAFWGFYFGVLYWFVPAYLLLYAISPALNAFIKHSSTRLYLNVLLLFFALEFALGWIGNFASIDGGYSTISFIGLYLLAGFLRKHYSKIQNISIGKNFLLYILFTLMPVVMFMMTGRGLGMLKYSSPFVVLASVFFFLTFCKMKLSNKTVNYIACSAFSVYLIHLHPMVAPHFKSLMNWAYDLFGGVLYMLLVVLFAIIFLIACALLDKIRIFVWNWICKVFLNPCLNQMNKILNRIFTYIGFDYLENKM